MTDLEHAVESNRRAWDASADSHLRGSGWQELSLAVQETGFSCLDETLAGVLRNLDLAGKAAVQVGCNNGREVLRCTPSASRGRWGSTSPPPSSPRRGNWPSARRISRVSSKPMPTSCRPS